MALAKLRIEAANLEAGRAASLLIERLDDPAPIAVTLFELKAPRFVVEAYFDRVPAVATVERQLAQVAGLGQACLEVVPDQNWVALSQASLPPVAAGRFIVHGSHDRARFAMRRLAIEIDAGEAFGSGHNATTALCLEALDGLTRRRSFARVLDLGCGSGVLAIAAARALPAAQVVAVDNDPIAVAVAEENARLNGVAPRLRVLRATGLDHRVLRHAQPFDLVLANLLPGPLVQMASRMRRSLGAGGVAVLSGLLAHQAREVAAAYGARGFHLVCRLQDEGWTALVVKRGPCAVRK